MRIVMLPCPFCGAVPRRKWRYFEWTLKHREGCFFRFNDFPIHNDELWNRRWVRDVGEKDAGKGRAR